MFDAFAVVVFQGSLVIREGTQMGRPEQGSAVWHSDWAKDSSSQWVTKGNWNRESWLDKSKLDSLKEIWEEREAQKSRRQSQSFMTFWHKTGLL